LTDTYYNWNFKAGFVYGEGKTTKSLVKTSSDVKTRLMQEMTDEMCFNIYVLIVKDWYINGVYERTDEVGWAWISYECYMITEGNYGNYDQYGYNNDDGGSGNNQSNQNNQPKQYQSTSSDKFFKNTSFNRTMETQVGETCALASMGYVNALFGGNTNYGTYWLAYAQAYSPNLQDALSTGISAENLPGFASNYFNTTTFLSYQNAIDNGHLVLTNIPTGQSYSHCVVIVGYHPNGDLIYMDPELGTLRECPASYPLGNINIQITGNK